MVNIPAGKRASELGVNYQSYGFGWRVNCRPRELHFQQLAVRVQRAVHMGCCVSLFDGILTPLYIPAGVVNCLHRDRYLAHIDFFH